MVEILIKMNIAKRPITDNMSVQLTIVLGVTSNYVRYPKTPIIMKKIKYNNVTEKNTFSAFFIDLFSNSLNPESMLFMKKYWYIILPNVPA